MDPAEVDGVLIETSVSTYVKVTSSPLVAVIFTGGVSEIAIGVGQNLTLDPEALSLDPDDPDMIVVNFRSRFLSIVSDFDLIICERIIR